MQTFLPYPDFARSARCLDYKRLGKQRVENLQIMQALLHCRLISKDRNKKDLPRERWTFQALKNPGWENHTATRMWRGYESCLLMYQLAITDEWLSRGYRDTCMVKTSVLYHYNGQRIDGTPWYPDWLGDERIHIGYQSNLIQKDPDYYGPIFHGVPDDLPYFWPVKE